MAKSIQRMELLVVNRLEGRLRAITPCSYISYFLRKMSKSDQEPSNTLISISLQVIASKAKGEKGLSLLFFLCFLGLKCWSIMVGCVNEQVLTFWSLDLLKLLLQWHFMFLENCTQYSLTTLPSLLFSHHFKR